MLTVTTFLKTAKYLRHVFLSLSYMKVLKQSLLFPLVDRAHFTGNFYNKRRAEKSSVKFVFRMRHSKERVTDDTWHLGWVKGNQPKKWTFSRHQAQRSNWSCVNRWDKIDKKMSAENQRKYQLPRSLKAKRQSTRKGRP